MNQLGAEVICNIILNQLFKQTSLFIVSDDSKAHVL